MSSRLALLALTSIAFAAAGEAPQNPAPAGKLEGYAKYELRDLSMEAPYAGQKPNERAATKLREHLASDVAPLVETWNANATAESDKTLTIEPRIQDIRFISGGKRFLGGAMAGNSHVVIKMRITDSSGTLIAEPQFYQRASAMAGAWSMGGHDNAMLQRVVTLMAEYLRANYSAAVGGSTGYEP